MKMRGFREFGINSKCWRYMDKMEYPLIWGNSHEIVGPGSMDRMTDRFEP